MAASPDNEMHIVSRLECNALVGQEPLYNGLHDNQQQ